MKKYAYAIGLGTKNSLGEWLEIFYPQPYLVESLEEMDLELTSGELDASQIEELIKKNTSSDSFIQSLSKCSQPVALCVMQLDQPPKDILESYLKLHLISHRMIKPHQTNLQGIFSILPNVAWTNKGAIDIRDLQKKHIEARMNGTTLSVKSVDKFPPMSDYIVPKGVRIADTSRVRLGAYIGEGTTIMHEGFVNFNAGTEGRSMIEGRISAGVFVGEDSDLGGGSSTMGTLSGGGNIIISLGKRCLIGANAGTGIPLGDDCIIEAGLYITASTKVTLITKEDNLTNQVVKARDLAGKNSLLFRRNSITGTIECLVSNNLVELNKELHDNNG